MAKSWGFVAGSVLELLGLAIWIGGLLVIVGAVIPAVFNVGMEPGGRLLTRVFDGYNRMVAGSIVLLVMVAVWRVWVSRARPGMVMAFRRTELALLTGMIAISTAIMTWLGPESVVLQEQAFAAEGYEAKKAAWEAFFRSHWIVRALYLTCLGLGIALLVVKVRQWTGDRAS